MNYETTCNINSKQFHSQINFMYKDALHHGMTGEISIVYFILEYIFIFTFLWHPWRISEKVYANSYLKYNSVLVNRCVKSLLSS